MSPAPAPISQSLIAHWRKTRLALHKLSDLYAADPGTPVLVFPIDQIRELIELFDALLEECTQSEISPR